MRELFAATVLLLLAVSVPTSGGEKQQEICGMCECLENTRPYDVDCTNMEFRKVPDLSSDNFTFNWLLNLGNNLIQEIPEIPRQDKLISLNFKRNRISTIADGAFKNLINLKELYLQANNLSGDAITQDAFIGLYNSSAPDPLDIEVLDLSYNYIKSLNAHAFMHLRSLKRLFLAHNPLKDISLNTALAINDLSNLQELDLSQTGISRLPDHFLTDLTSLQVLTLAGNNFQVVPGEINFAHNLRHLNLNANPIESLTLGDFQDGLNTLRELDISAMPLLRNVGSLTFSSLKSLERLSMSNCPFLSVIDPRAFFIMEGDEPALKEIHIQDNQLKSLDESMLPWLQLQYVDIQNNPWHCDCHFKWVVEKLVPDLTAKNPQTTISILCAEPLEDRGTPAVDLLSRPHSFVCESPHSIPEGHQSMFGPLAVGIIVVGALLMFTGSLIFAYVLFRRAQSRQMFGETVKYRRAHNDDEAGPS